MHSWFTQKLNEMIGLAHYCQYPILKAHLILTQKTVDEIYGSRKSEDDTLVQVLPLMISQAEIEGKAEAAHHMRQALHALDRKPILADNVVEVDFNAQDIQCSQSRH